MPLLYKHTIFFDYESINKYIIEQNNDGATRFKLKPEIKKWLNENIGYLKWKSVIYAPVVDCPIGLYEIRFLSITDATAFKLRWI